jgi:hypothetical protein
MANALLPPDLERLEHLLANGPRPAPSAALRRRVLAGVQSELRRQLISLRWRFAAAFAAAVLAMLSFSLAAAQATSFVQQQHESTPSVREVAKQIQQRSPDISPEESIRRAMLMEIVGRVGCRPTLGNKLNNGNAG